MAKGAEAFRSIGEVAKLIGVAPHVLRYWETQFSLLKPMKRGDGRRYYRPDDVRLAAGLCEVLRDEGLTIRGAKKLLAKDRGESVRARGAQKLGEVMEVEAARPAAAHPVEAVASPIEPVEPPAPDRPDSLSRARSRKRPAVRGPEPLPLFPEDTSAVRVLPADPGQARWLGRLIRFSARLHSHPGGAALSSAARGQAHRLLDAIADHY